MVNSSGINPNDETTVMPEESTVQIVARLRQGETYARAIIIPANRLSADLLKATKRKLKQDLSPVIARAKKQAFGTYRLHTVEAFTIDYDVVVVSIIVRESDL